jgi:hypothetical protein
MRHHALLPGTFSYQSSACAKFNPALHFSRRRGRKSRCAWIFRPDLLAEWAETMIGPSTFPVRRRPWRWLKPCAGGQK